MFNFIDAFIEYQQYAESPTEFWRWAALSCLTTVLRDNIYLIVRNTEVMPNMYVIIYGISGNVRKGAPVKFAGKLVKAINNTKIMAGRNSMQFAVKDLAKVRTDDSGKMIVDASGLLYSEELSAMMVDDSATIPLLIELYDYHHDWSSGLVSDGKLSLKKVCLSMLAASNDELFTGVYSASAIKGGLLGRTIVVKCDQARQRRSLLRMPPEDPDKYKALVEHLKMVSNLKGPVQFTSEAASEYDNWYENGRDQDKVDKIGFASRLGTHVLKVAIGVAAAREDFSDRIIKKEDITQAIMLCLEVKRSYKTITLGTGASSTAYQCSLIVRAIASYKGTVLPRKTLIQQLLGDIDIKVLDEAILLLVQSQLIREAADSSGGLGYQITQAGVDLILKGETQ